MSSTKVGVVVKIIVLLFLVVACTALNYVTDKGFKVSAQANSFEFPVKLNGFPCKDMVGKIGTCVTQTGSKNPLTIYLIPRPYSYTVSFKCSAGLDFSKSFDVAENKEFSVAIEDYRDLKFFQCIGELFPDDREVEVSSKFWFFVKVVDSEYDRREEIYKDEEYFVIGKHSKYVTICYKDGKCKMKKKLTYYKDKDNDVASIVSESEAMRFNYYGI